MAEFKPMVKMMTTEPSVILKLKKGGHVNSKEEAKESHGHSPMTKNDKYCEEGESPKKPSMSERRKSMSAAVMMKKGGKANGGLMTAPNPALMSNRNVVPPVTQSMTPAALARMRQLAAARQNMTGVPAMKKGGKTDTAQDKAMIKKAFKQHDVQEHKGGKGTNLKLKTGGTIEGNAGKYVSKIVDGDKTDKAHGTKGVKEQNAGGFKSGGAISKFVNTKVVDGDKTDKAHGTGEVKEKNAGGYKSGGKVNWENLPANGTPPGVTNRTTGGVREANAGGFKKGGSAKKAFATGGSVVDDGKAVKMPKHFVSRPVANSLQSGTFKKGGKVKKFADGGNTEDMSKGAYDSVAKADREENEGIRNSILGAPAKAYNAIKRMLGSTPDSTAEAGRGFINPPSAKARGR